MSNWPEYRNPPVQEAVLEFRFVLRNTDGQVEIQNFYEKIRDRFPTKKARVQLKLKLPIGANAAGTEETKTERTSDGWILNQQNGNTAIQVSSNLLSYHIIKPYRNWPALINEGKAIWEEFLSCVEQVLLNKVSLRFVNKIDVMEPSGRVQVNNHLALLPSIPDGIPNEMEGFFMQIKIVNKEHDINAIVTESLGSKVANNKSNIILDINVFKNVNYEGTDSQIWDDVLILREFKNQIFENSLTKTAKSKF